MGAAPWIMAGLVAGGILHLLCIMGLPSLAAQDAFSRLSARLGSNTLFVPASLEAEPLPFSPPDVMHAYCPFDISERNLVVTSPLAEQQWSIAVTTQSGENFYIQTGADAKKPEVRLLLVPRERLSEEASTEYAGEGSEQSIVVSPASKGVVTIRAPLKGESFREQTAQLLRSARCELQKAAEPPEPAVVTEGSAPVDSAAAAKGSRLQKSRETHHRRQSP